ncbi:MAG TPA: 3-oxoadipate enol-lactonase, partial [Roseovarius nubinhibens]|nr:3-oxoadipate enol-lactonase [Roseovarius nubinhibens]
LATLPDTGHLPCVEAPAAYAAILSDFLKETAHV